MNELTKSAALPKVMNPRITRQNLVALKSSTDVDSNIKMQCIRFLENMRSSFDCMSSMILVPDKAAVCAQKGGHIIRCGSRLSAARCAECDKPITSAHELRKEENGEDATYGRINYWVADNAGSNPHYNR